MIAVPNEKGGAGCPGPPSLGDLVLSDQPET